MYSNPTSYFVVNCILLFWGFYFVVKSKMLLCYSLSAQEKHSECKEILWGDRRNRGRGPIVSAPRQPIREPPPRKIIIIYLSLSLYIYIYIFYSILVYYHHYYYYYYYRLHSRPGLRSPKRGVGGSGRDRDVAEPIEANSVYARRRHIYIYIYIHIHT